MDTDYDKLWADIFLMLKQEQSKLPYEKTIAELSQQFGYGKEKMRREADRLIKRGLLISREFKSKNGKVCKVYAPVPSENSGHKPTETSEEK